jgi:hypothetical protein
MAEKKKAKASKSDKRETERRVSRATRKSTVK